MKEITIAERLRPFSHQMGTVCLLPGTSFYFEIFPSLIRVYDLSVSRSEATGSVANPVKEEIKRNCQGPVRQFTVQLDLEKAKICVWGFSNQEFFRYHIHSTADGKGYFIFEDKEKKEGYTPPLTDRLSLRSQKSQDWEMIQRRQDLAEIFPLWLRLGQLVPQMEVEKLSLEGGTLDFFQACQGRDLQSFMNFFHAAFKGLLVPTLNDEKHQGFTLSTLKKEVRPLVILSEGAKLIRSLFFYYQFSEMKILPSLPIEFHAGRLINLQFEYGLVDIEWSKKQIRRLNVRTLKSGEIHLSCQKDVKRCRLRVGDQDKGKHVLFPLTLALEADTHYYFDNFQS